MGKIEESVKLNDVYGDLIVKSFSGIGSSKKALCRCTQCGAEGSVTIKNLYYGRTKGCKHFINRVIHHDSGYTEIIIHGSPSVLIDTEDYNLFNSRSVGVQKYASTKENGKSVRIHRLIMMKHHGENIGLVDHLSRNKLDNRKSNLRITGHSVNNQNRTISQKTSKYKGVHQDKNGFYVSQITHDRKQIYIIRTKDEILAAKEYDKKAIELFGEDACTNKSLGLL